jgi:uncharacterized Rmd1/YagE family protein
METVQFAAYALTGELDLNRLAQDLGAGRKYRWEEPMLLNPVTFTTVVDRDKEREQVYLYYFGGVVFVNCSGEMIGRFFGELAKVSELFRGVPQVRFRDDYALKFSDGDRPSITNDCAVMPSHDPAFVDIICFVIAKSVALERIEERADTVLDEMEGLIAQLGSGKLNIPDRRLASLASSVLTFKYASIAQIMVLDKPDITWDNPEADRLYLTMANLFELSQRYQEIKHKSETLLDVTTVFTGLSHARRSARLEWIIIVLIFIEILIYVFEIMHKS